MKCELCGKIQKTMNSLHCHYRYHLQKEDDENQKEKINLLIKQVRIYAFKCKICEKILSSKQKLDDHLLKCNSIRQSSIENKTSRLKEIVCSLTSDLQILDEVSRITDYLHKTLSLNKDESNMNDCNNNNTNFNNINIGDNNNNNNINNNIFNGVRSTNKQSVDMYDAPLSNKKELIAIFGDPKLRKDVDNMFLSIDKYFNYNKNYPENHNILVTNHKKYKPCMVKENDEWIQKQGEGMKKIFYDRITTCNELYINLIPSKLKQMFPEKKDEIEKMTDYICNVYSDETDSIKERLWYKFFEQAYLHKQLMKETYNKDLALENSI